MLFYFLLCSFAKNFCSFVEEEETLSDFPWGLEHFFQSDLGKNEKFKVVLKVTTASVLFFSCFTSFYP